jgi:Concanavalin A-like lectin/glucanases superfamily
MRRVALFILVSFLFISSVVSGDLLTYYDFELQPSTIVVDRSGNAHHGTMEYGFSGTPDKETLPQYVTSHDSSYAMRFGYNDSGTPGVTWNNFSVPKKDDLVFIGQSWSMAFWCRQDMSNAPDGNSFWGPAYPRIISTPNYEIELGAGDEGDSASYFWPFNASPAYPDAASWDFGMANNPEDTWFHMAVTYDGTTFRQYINGTQVYTRATMGSFVESTWGTLYAGVPLRIGAQCNDNKSYLVGLLDDVAIWNETLSPSEVSDVMSGDYFVPYKTPITVGVPEDDKPITYLYDPSFIVRYNNDQVVLDYDEKAPGEMSWNWQMEGTLSDPNVYGLVNAGLWDGDESVIEYAGYCTVGDNISQVALGRIAFEDIKYEFKARVGGENAIGNVVGVKFYRVDLESPYGNEVLVSDLNTTIAANDTWYELSGFYNSVAADDNHRFKAVCYIEQGTGPGRGDTFGYFDYVRIDPNEFLSCEAMVAYNFGESGLSRDLNNDCRVDLVDFSIVAGEWLAAAPPEPSINAGELLMNSDFYADLDLVPNNMDYVGAAPTGWEFVPATTNPDAAGIQNLDRDGMAANSSNQPAGGSVVAYIDPNTMMQQVVSSTPIQNGETYYISSMVGGLGGPYLSMLTMTLEYVNSPTNPTTIVEIADPNFIMPENLAWRQVTAEYTADASAAGNYLRLKFDYGSNPFPGSVASGYGAIGKTSITTVKPETWPRENLLVNGDFEDYSSLSMGTNNNDGWLDLFSFVAHWTQDSIPGWDASSNASGYYGLQCMLWAPAPQPVMGRVSAWFADKIEQKVTSETIQDGQTYYLDYIASINSEAYVSGSALWPDEDPNMVVDIYWLASGEDDLTGTEDLDWGLITSLGAPITGSLVGNGDYDNPYGPWVSSETNFTADMSLDGKSFYVSAYCNNAGVDYATFEEIYLSKAPRAQIGPYTCYEQTNVYGITNLSDLNGDCSVDLDDLVLLADNWLGCNDPTGCL